MSRLLFVLVVPLLFTAPSQDAQAQREISCRSRDRNYNYCRVNTENRVRLVERTSRSSCREGSSWGYDRHGIWVDNGCGARFAYGRGSDRRDRRNSNRDRRDRRHDDDHDGDAAAAVAVGAGLAILLGAAVASSSSKHHKHDSHHSSSHNNRPPSWMVGTFEGYNDTYNSDVEITVHSDGTVDVRVDGSGRVRGDYRDGKIHVGRSSFDVERAGSGFRTIDRSDRDNEVRYRRTR